MAELGPLELLFVAFPGNQFTGEIVPELEALVESGTINIIDLVFVAKDAEGNSVGFELEHLDDSVRETFGSLANDLEGLISEEDVEDLAEALEPNSSAAILLFEHLWETPLRNALVNAGGELLARIPVSPEALAEVAAARG